MSIRYLIYTTIFLGLLALFCYYRVDLPNLLSVSLLRQEQPIIIKLSAIIQALFHFIIWLGLSCLFLLIGYCRKKSFKQFMQKKTTQFWLGIIFSMSICGVLKIIIGRYRPEMFLTHHLFGFVGLTMKDSFHSMPSDHTVLLFSIATTLGYFLRSKTAYFFLYLLAFICAASRVVLYRHYPSDVLTGALVGMWGSYFAYYFCNLFRRTT